MAVLRGTPAGTKLPDGYQSLITLTNDTDIEFFEKTVQPPGADGGDSVDQTTMHNVTVVTKAAQTLIDFTDSPSTVAYDPIVLNSILAQININQLVTYLMPDGSTWDFFGYLQKFEPSPLVRGEQPEATVTIVVTNVDLTGAEIIPNYISPGGTDI